MVISLANLMSEVMLIWISKWAVPSLVPRHVIFTQNSGKGSTKKISINTVKIKLNPSAQSLLGTVYPSSDQALFQSTAITNLMSTNSFHFSIIFYLL